MIEGKKVVLVVGVWDLLHVGHVRFLEKAAQLGDLLVVGVLTDSQAAWQKRRPVIPFEQRKEMLAALWMVDYVVDVWEVNRDDTLERLGYVDILVHGERAGEVFRGARYIRRRGGQAVKIPYSGVTSTTAIMLEARRRLSGD